MKLTQEKVKHPASLLKMLYVFFVFLSDCRYLPWAWPEGQALGQQPKDSLGCYPVLCGLGATIVSPVNEDPPSMSLVFKKNIASPGGADSASSHTVYQRLPELLAVLLGQLAPYPFLLPVFPPPLDPLLFASTPSSLQAEVAPFLALRPNRLPIPAREGNCE